MPISEVQMSLGCDPELFLQNAAGDVVGSQNLLGKFGTDGTGRIARDGVQIELHPTPAGCRANLGNNLKYCFQQLRTELAKKKLTADFSTTVVVPKAQFEKLDEESKVFGCEPSHHIEGDNSITVNAATSRERSAGGHIHVGLTPYWQNAVKMGTAPPESIRSRIWRAVRRCHKTLVPLYDLMVGNTCVLLDRNPVNIERRKVFGRAGEYRKPPWGIEYRVLSNFWLRSYPLFSFVLGLMRWATLIRAHDDKMYLDILGTCSRDNVVKAINNNDFDLALENFRAMINPALSVLPRKGSPSSVGYGGHPSYGTAFWPLCPETVSHFYEFLESGGIDRWFTEPPMEHWCRPWEGHGCGWENFIGNTFPRAMKLERIKNGR